MEKNYEKPLVVSILNKGNKEEIFIPYRENMQFPLRPNEMITFDGLDSESAIYYEKQSTKEIVARIKSQVDESNVITGNYNSTSKEYTEGASYQVIQENSSENIQDGKTTLTLNYKVYGKLPYLPGDKTLGNPAGNKFTIKIKNEKITSRDDLPSGKDIATSTVVGGDTLKYSKDAFEDDGSLISVVNVSKRVTSTITIKWSSTETYIYNFDLSEVSLGKENEVIEESEEIDIKLPLNITIKNNGKSKVGYIPYKQNFEEYLESGDSIDLTVEKAEEAMYYLLQANEELEVKESSNDEPSIGSESWLINEIPDVNVETFLLQNISGKVNPLTANETYGEPTKMYMIGVQKGNAFIAGTSPEGYGGVMYGSPSGGEKTWQFLTKESASYTVKDTTKLRTIVFDEPVTDKGLLTWLKSNAKKI